MSIIKKEMENLFITIICLTNLLGYSQACDKETTVKNDTGCTFANYGADTLNNRSNDFNSYIMQFDTYEKRIIDKNFFNTRSEREGEMHIEITKSKYSSFIPYDSTCNCGREELYYHPCQKIENNDFYIVGINGYCDFTTTVAFPYCAEFLVTYDKSGNIIDFIIVGYYSDIEYCTIETTEKVNELKVTQYSFNYEGPHSRAYSGACKISEYTITVNSNGIIDKDITREYTGNVTLQPDW